MSSTQESAAFTPTPTATGTATLTMQAQDNVLKARADRQADASSRPLCSVLNTVVDHVMVQPTPMEPKEYQEALLLSEEQQQQTKQPNSSSLLLVPVLRIFGPILRRDLPSSFSSTTTTTTQSACLYIHGAFPYLLARPAAAGPDGSLHRSSHLLNNNKLTPSGHIDWDDAESVERIAPILQENLEAAIQSSLRDSSFGTNNNIAGKAATLAVQARVIRQVTVVVGRGFYTFCPGPPAPFMRVEYYDPKLRWKVKLMLERGLDLPALYHADPLQYNALGKPSSSTPVDDDTAAAEALQFHCYEAHIPYTMQFFKDWNLAGMSHVHCRAAGVQFRSAMPRSARHQWTTSHSSKTALTTDSLFLESNTPAEYVWMTAADAAGADSPDSNVGVPFSNDSPPPVFASLQQPSPMDPQQNSPMSTASDDGNVENPLEQSYTNEWVVSPTTAPRLASGRIASAPPGPWTKKETSCDVELDIMVQDILNVCEVITELPDDRSERQQLHWRAVPSLREIWKQERRRMAKLLKPQDDFLSCASPDTADNDINNNTKAAATPPFTLSVKKGASLPGTRLAREGMQRLVDVTDGLQDNFQRVLKDIVDRHADAVGQVDRVLDGREQQQEAGDKSMETVENAKTTPSFDETMDALGALGSAFQGAEASDSQLSQEAHSFSQESINVPLSSRLSLTQGLSQGSELSFRGESTSLSREKHFQSLSQSYYDTIDDGTNIESQSHAFELSQRVERGDCVVDGPFEHIEDFIDPETLVPFEAVDDDGELSGEEEEEDVYENRLERMLSTLATQTLTTGIDMSLEETTQDIKGDTSIADSEKHVLSVDVYLPLEASDEGPSDEDSTSSVNQDIDHSREAPVSPATNYEEPTELLPEEGNDSFAWPRELSGRVLARQRSRPPTRREIVGSSTSTSLYPMQSKGNLPSWMVYSIEYDAMTRGRNTRKTWFPQGKRGLWIRPVGRPPSRRTVSSWHRKAFKRSHPPVSRLHDVGKRTRVDHQGLAKETVASMAALQIDGNSRNLVAVTGDNENGTGDQEVEEVVWLPSQQPIMSLTQQSLEDTPIRRAGNNVVIRKNTLKMPDSQTSNDVQSGIGDKTSYSDIPSFSKSTPDLSMPSATPSPQQALQGIGNQGGRIWVEGGGHLKSKTRPSQGGLQKESATNPLDELTRKESGSDYLPSPVSVMAIEVYIQCRTGRAGVNDSKQISMAPDPDRDKVVAVVYILAKDPGGGEKLAILERGCLFVPVERELMRAQGDKEKTAALFDHLSSTLRASMPRTAMGVKSPFSAECVRDERQLLLRICSIVRWKDPDMLLSWDTQGGGLGYLIERGAAIGKSCSGPVGNGVLSPEIDMARLFGRTPTVGTRSDVKPIEQLCKQKDETTETGADQKSAPRDKDSSRSDRWKGSGLGNEWDDRVGAGAAAASIIGRLVFAGWKIIAEEVKHPNASYLPAVVSTVLGTRIPFHDNLKLSQWYGHDSGREQWRVIHHKLTQATACLLLFDALDIIGRAGEAARLSGVEFSQSFPGIRGSQYKVEGVLLRALQSLNSDERGSKQGWRRGSPGDYPKTSMSGESISQTQSPWKARRRPPPTEKAKSSEPRPFHQLSDRCYFFYSPSLTDSNKQEALECQALTLEPQSGHEESPVVVCDFTALYPSLVIAYNLCYSTVAGRLDYHSTRSEMRWKGKTTGKLGPFLYSESRTATVLKHHMRSFQEDAERQDRVYVAPTGTIYVSESVVKGVLPQVLDEMLSTRAMLKKAAKQYKKLVPDLSPSILRQLEARQLALKYVANVTYGYTSATFSGRCAMPLLADTIVECGRRTLTNAIFLANSWGRDQRGRWRGCEVIYGDTDSLFIKLPGRSVQEAFQFGEEFTQAVTASNPPPVQLKLEKVYLGSIMQTKKKYCGMKFESKDQRKPTFEAKGLETVRRDQCALTQKVLRNSLVTLFRHGIEAVKAYLYRQWALILAGKLPVSDFILTGRVRSRYRGGRVGPVQAVLARRLAEADPGRVTRHKERLAYVIVATPGVTFKLRDCVLTPMELLEQWDAYTIHSAYYIVKHVNAALQRCFGLAPHKIDISTWYESCPKPRRRIHFWPTTRSGSSLMISSYFGSDICSLCGRKCMSQGRSRAAVCFDCREDDVKALVAGMERLNATQRNSVALAKRCNECNLCFEDAGTFATLQNPHHSKPKNLLGSSRRSDGIVTPLANCSCIDCPTTFERHRLREAELEATAICETLGAF